MPDETKIPVFLPDETSVSLLGKTKGARRNGALPDFDAVRRDCAVTLSDEALAHLQDAYRKAFRRPPTVGELRILDALSRIPRSGDVAHRHAVGEWITDAPELAETWADMMEKHAALSAAAELLPPPTYEDALSLVARYLCRTGRRDAVPSSGKRGKSIPERVLLFTPAAEVEAAVEGFDTVARIRLSDRSQAAIARRERISIPERVPRAGDVLLYARAVPGGVLSAFIKAQAHMAKPDVSTLRVVTRLSLLESAAELSGGMDLYAYTLGEKGEERYIPVDRLCGVPSAEWDEALGEPRADVVLCTSVNRATYVVSDLKARGVETVAIGQVRRDAKVSVCVKNPVTGGHLVAATFSLRLLESARAVASHTCTVSLSEAGPLSYPVSLARLPGVHARESGVTPAGWELVALTATPDPVLSLPEEHLLLTATGASVSPEESGYRAARDAVKLAVLLLQTATVTAEDAGEISLAVSLRVRTDAHDRLAETVCGLYRAAAEEGIPILDPALTFEEPSASEPNAPAVSLSVIAWAQATAPATDTGYVGNPSPDDRQWKRPASRPAESAVRFYLPTLRRSMEGSLAALTHALSRRTAAKCVLQPLVIDREEIPVFSDAPADLPDAEPPLPTYETRETLREISAQKLSAILGGDAMPVFAMSESDARLLLASDAVRSALDARLGEGRTVLVMGDACLAFAACGYLPLCPVHVTRRPYSGTAAVSYHGMLASSLPSTRLVRSTLLIPEGEEAPHLLTLTLPDGTTVPDGFPGAEGRVLGLLNGLDAVMEACLDRDNFCVAPPPPPPIDPEFPSPNT